MDIAIFEHAEGIAAGHADSLLRSMHNSEYWTEETGDLESPVGSVTLIQITPDLVAEYASAAGDPWVTEARNFEPGWYILQMDDSGLIWGHSYGGWCREHQAFCADTLNEQNARADFAAAQKAYSEWLDECEPEDDEPESTVRNLADELPVEVHASAIICLNEGEELVGYRPLLDHVGPLVGTVPKWQVVTTGSIFEITPDGVVVRASTLHSFDE